MQSSEVKQSNPNLKIILVGILLLGVFLATFFIWVRQHTENGIFSSTIDPKNIISNTENNDPLEVFYYTQDDFSQQSTQYKIFKVSPNFEEADINTHSFTIAGSYPTVITDSWKKNVILFVTNSETQAIIYSLDISSRNSQPQTLLTVPLDSDEGDIIGSAKYLDDGNAIAFITSNIESERAKNSVLNIVSLKNEQKKETIPLTEVSPLYAGFGFLAATLDSNTIYLHETGGDGGYMWSQWYKIDRDTKKVQKLEGLPPIAKGGENPATSVFSPDLTKLAYTDFSSTIDPADLSNEAGYFGQCLTFNSDLLEKYTTFGGTVMIQNLSTRKADEVFRNLSYQDNFCRNIGTRIISLEWLDNSRLAFETIDGIYLLDTSTKQTKTLFTFEKTISPGEQKRPSIQHIKLPFILFSDGSIVQVSSNKRLESIAPEPQSRFFFSF